MTNELQLLRLLKHRRIGMPTGRLTMRRIRDVLRLKFAQGLSERAIASSLGLGKGSVGTYLRRARDAGLGWPLPEGLDDDSLELLLFPNASDGSVAKIVKLEHAWRRLDGRNDDGFQVAPFPG
jgi:hypothetical protein